MRDGEPGEADLVIVNTCSVTAEADRAARAYIRRAHRRNPDAHILVTGCYAQRAPEELAALPGVSAVVGNSHKTLTPSIALNLIQLRTAPSAQPGFVPIATVLGASRPSAGGAALFVDDQFAHSFLEEAQLAPGEQTRPNLKIQEGCGNRCTFCIIPQTRGSSRSLPEEAVLRQVRGFIAAGGKELVLSGINLGRWGRDLEAQSGTRPSLPALIQKILTDTELPQLRISSVEPMDWNAELIGLMQAYAGTRIARHAHLPLQSGSDAVLRRMHRRYRPWHYEQKVEALQRAVGPGLTVGADVMIGFPGETDREFQETADFIARLPFGYLHLFPFSPRPGTRGWALNAESPVAPAAVEERMTVLRALAAEKVLTHRKRFLGRDIRAITLHPPKPAKDGKDTPNQGSRTPALSENFLPITIDGSIAANTLLRVRCTKLSEDATLWAVPVPAA